jgi:hypothetical protein
MNTNAVLCPGVMAPKVGIAATVSQVKAPSPFPVSTDRGHWVTDQRSSRPGVSPLMPF